MLPLKAPYSHEPVILDITNMVVAVCGIDALGKRIEETCHRPNIVARILSKSEEDIVDINDFAYILSSKDGSMKALNEEKMEYRVIINKVDNNKLLKEAIKIAKKIENKSIKVIITSYRYCLE